MRRYCCVSFVFASSLMIGSVLSGEHHHREVRQTTTYAFNQSSFVLSIPRNTPGTYVNGRAYTNYDSGTVWTIVFPTNNFAINMNTGYLVAINYLQSCWQYVVTVRANNARGTIQTNVVIQTGSTTSTCSSSYTGGTIGSGVTTGPQFTQPTGYTLATGNCAANAYVGTVNTTNSATYTLVSPYFNINPVNGMIFIITPPPSSPTVVGVSATNSAGQTTTVPVTIYTSNCPASSNTYPVFGQTSYAFTVSSCAAGSQVGYVTAASPGATVTYSLYGGGANYAINSNTGLITISSPPVAGTQQMIYVTATDNLGRTKTTPVTVVVTSTCTSAATTTTTSTTTTTTTPTTTTTTTTPTTTTTTTTPTTTSTTTTTTTTPTTTSTTTSTTPDPVVG